MFISIDRNPGHGGVERVMVVVMVMFMVTQMRVKAVGGGFSQLTCAPFLRRTHRASAVLQRRASVVPQPPPCLGGNRIRPNR